MDQTIKSKWVTALRSGDYNQGYHVLRQGNRYCCLGVLCDLHSKAHPGNRYTWRQPSDCAPNYFYDDHEYEHLPGKVQYWAGIDCYGEVITLAQLNDEGHTFAQIAQHIEEQL